MNTQLSRVQIYLERQDVSVLDELARKIRVSRSQIIRDATKAVSERYLRLLDLVDAGRKHARSSVLQNLIGIESSKTGSVGLAIDDIYKDES